MMASFNIIVAIDAKNGIGREGALPWRLSGDLKHFKEITQRNVHGKKNVVVMGRKTWESIPKGFLPLTERLNVVLTRNAQYSVPRGVWKAEGLDQALSMLLEHQNQYGEIFIIGGQEIFDLAIGYPQCKRLYVTHILHSYNCDTWFPPISGDYTEVGKGSMCFDEGVEYYFAEYENNSM